ANFAFFVQLFPFSIQPYIIPAIRTFASKMFPAFFFVLAFAYSVKGCQPGFVSFLHSPLLPAEDMGIRLTFDDMIKQTWTWTNETNKPIAKQALLSDLQSAVALTCR